MINAWIKVYVRHKLKNYTLICSYRVPHTIISSLLMKVLRFRDLPKHSDFFHKTDSAEWLKGQNTGVDLGYLLLQVPRGA